jgi:peptidoglycan pentaglycine glycine transferase (the first glycine)
MPTKQVRGRTDRLTGASERKRWAQWDAFVASQPSPGFMQSEAWIRCRAGQGIEHLAVWLRDETSTLVGGALVGRWAADGRAIYYVQDGPILPHQPEDAQLVMQALLARIERMRQEDQARVSHLRIEPRRPLGDWPEALLSGFEPARGSDSFREPRYTRMLDLSLDDDARLAAMTPKGRYNVRVARRHGVTVVCERGRRALDEFMDIRLETAVRQGLKVRPRSHFGDILRAFGENADLYFAQIGSRRLAAALVIRFGGLGIYFMGASRAERRDAMAPYLLHHEIACALRAQGCRHYDLWGTAPPDKPDHPFAAITEFKRKLGGAEIAWMPTLDLVYDREAYDAFCHPERNSRGLGGAVGGANPAPAVAVDNPP